MNTTDFLGIASAICPDRDFIVFEGKGWTFDQVNNGVNRVATALGKMGIVKGNRDGMLQVNCTENLETYFTFAEPGAIFVP